MFGCKYRGYLHKQFVYVGKSIAADAFSMEKARTVQQRSTGTNIFNIGTIHASSGPVNVGAHPMITVFYTINRNKNLKIHQSLIMTCDMDVDISLVAKTEVGGETHIMWLSTDIYIPANMPGLCDSIRRGLL